MQHHPNQECCRPQQVPWIEKKSLSQMLKNAKRRGVDVFFSRTENAFFHKEAVKKIFFPSPEAGAIYNRIVEFLDVNALPRTSLTPAM